ncbi:MAG: S8 family serine peptidase [Hyphomicrobiaceae bacterium]|nr:S8 family serine peptidase [Hyphomicrobiaceae bacterium]MCC0024430.1 S8 family serine peptidase [Hyphomicrobiaceae bacterium]
MTIEDNTNNIASDGYEIQGQALVIPAHSSLNGAQFWSLQVGGMGSARFQSAWDYATGAGITIGLVDEGVNYTHLDLVDSYNSDIDYDPQDPDGQWDAMPDDMSQQHGTEVAGIISGSIYNSIGTFGAAPDATISASYQRFGSSVNMDDIVANVGHQSTFDVSNNSWGFTASFADNFNNSTFHGLATAIQSNAETGRGGLGTSFVVAAGNSKLMANGENIGGDSNFHNLSNSRFAIAVGAHDSHGNSAFFSSPGTNVLISAPGVALVTTSGNEGGSSDSAYVSGTSFAAPMVSAAIALMLEVNPNLGYRDVQEILAITAKTGIDENGAENGAGNVNGGGLYFSRDLGFGSLDAEAAVHLAKVWTASSTAANEAHLTQAFALPATTDASHQELTLDLTPETFDKFATDFVELSIAVDDADLKDLSIELVSPDGTHSLIAPNLNAAGSATSLSFTFSSVAHWGENPFGTWTLILSHDTPSDSFSVKSASLDVYGDFEDENDEYYFTSSFAQLAGANDQRKVIEDTDGGEDTLNFAAAGKAVSLNMHSGALSHVEGAEFVVNGDFEDAIGTVKGDSISGNALNNVLRGEAGADRLDGGEGDDTLLGGSGNDKLVGGAGADYFDGGAGFDTLIFARSSSPVSIDLGSNINGGAAAGDTIVNVEAFVLTAENDQFWAGIEGSGTTIHAGKGNDVVSTNAGNDLLDGGEGRDTLIGGLGDDTYIVDNKGDRVSELLGGGHDLVKSKVSFSLNQGDKVEGQFEDLVLLGGARKGSGNNADNHISGSRSSNVLDGDRGDDTLAGRGGDDRMHGGQGDDVLNGGTGRDVASGDAGADRLNGGKGNDRLDGGSGNDLLSGSQGKDQLSGSAGKDNLSGGTGADRLDGGNDRDHLAGGSGNDHLSGGRGNDVLTGGRGRDVFVFGKHDGADTITDFGTGHDRLNLSAFHYKTKAEALADFKSVGHGNSESVVFEHAQTKIKLDGFDIHHLDGSDLII